jgi:hypothetical protein
MTNNPLLEFEFMKDESELKSLSKISLERPLSDTEYFRLIKLKEKLKI